jgi:predicted transcriptional regulator
MQLGGGNFLRARCRTGIVDVILQAVAGEPLAHTKVICQTMLNFDQLNHHTPFLIRKSWLRYPNLNRKSAIIDKGRKQLLGLFNETDKLLMTLDKDDYNISAEYDRQLLDQQQKPQEEVTVHK